jgi:DNA-directed RNA polymerase subunit H (RpoH/RPB5)
MSLLLQSVARILENAVRMLRDRGDQPHAPMVNDNEGVVLGNQFVVWLVDTRDEKLRVGVQHLRTARARWPDKKIVLLAHAGCTPYLASRVRGEVYDEECIDTEVFSTSAFHVDLPRHVLVPIHSVVPENHISEMLRAHSLKSVHCLPKLLSTDPVAQWYGWPVGTVVKVEREELQDSGIVLQCDALRVVI